MIKKMINYKHKMDRIYILKNPYNIEFKYDINDCIEQLKKIKLTYGRTYIGIVQHSGNVVVSKKIKWRSDCVLGYEHTSLFENEFEFDIEKNEDIPFYRKPYYKPFNDNDSISVSFRLGYPEDIEKFMEQQRDIRECQPSYKWHAISLKNRNNRRR